MTLLVDLGNTRLKLARSDAGRVTMLHVLRHADADFVERLREWVATQKVPRCLWLASVATSAVTRATVEVFEQAGYVVRRVSTQPKALGLEVGYAHFDQLGVDRWLALLALHLGVSAPCVVVSVGSALTCDALASGGKHLGGLIAPAPEGMRDALFARAPQLPAKRGQVALFASSTEDAIESGCVLAGVALIVHFQAGLATQLEQPVRLVVCGGGADALRSYLPTHEFRPHLVLEGLACWAAATKPEDTLNVRDIREN